MSKPDLTKELLSLIQAKQLYPLFQPVMDTSRGTVIGHEALIRGPKGHPLEFPDRLFSLASEAQLLSELELACRSAAMEAFQKNAMLGKLFLNVNPNVLQDDSHPHGSTLRLSQQFGITPEQIVIEISERYPIEDTKNLKHAIIHYQKLGFMIAIDDLGAGYSGLKLWSELRPDYVKIDRYFIHFIEKSSVKREFVQSILSLATSLRTKVIVEGVETDDELEQLQTMGVSYCQGFLLGRPTPKPVLEVPPSFLVPHHHITLNYQSTIASVVDTIHCVSAKTRSAEVLDTFTQDKTLSSLPVIHEKRVVGIIRREKIMEFFSGSYGHALYANKTVSHIMDEQPLLVDWQTSLEEVSQLITDNDEVDVFQHIIVTRKDVYYGVASIKNLLRKITELKVDNARHANPLTQLPGNVAINQIIEEQLSRSRGFHVAYFDLNYFKPYNDIYGYEQGDQIIKWLAQILQKHLFRHGHFVGHIGGDDFVAVFKDGHHTKQLCDNIINDFEQEIKRFYHQEHIDMGGIKALSRDGKPVFYPLLGLAIGVVQPDPSKCSSHHDVALLASEAKKEAKEFDGSHCYMCHRQKPRRLRQINLQQ
ncbi:bifunctional diguanylate cyclase/phosphodiesterase [Idiomarina sp. HP20-50]|uniref:bifunctional diguanylate cyclase/phosphodiesterase n=1 Tax=Idiomarina sp. HP20-50 TaxID=3070813 RepID=UPI00294AA597|nr:bifunctional diguanylate cyclase/phosphodiesterase [Idiomarina sp. HP20-50]MDV6316813.1 bifunctional diguanylate cyclase/phosphodiesterase [Idiomarina sp. HP20-50]